VKLLTKLLAEFFTYMFIDSKCS